MKKIYSTIFAISFGLNVVAQVSTNSLVADFPFNADANDASGNGNNGIVYGATLSSDRFGTLNSAYQFDGINDSIIIPNSSSLQFPDNKQSISFWIKVPSVPSPVNEQAILEKMDQHLSTDATGNAAMGFKVVFTGAGDICYSIKNGNTSGWASCIIPAAKYSANNYFNLVFTNDSDSLRGYVNGIKVSSAKVGVGISIGANNLSLQIGNDRWVSNGQSMDMFNGILDDLRIYSRAISPSEVSFLYNEGICKTSITVTDTLRINISTLGFNLHSTESDIKIYPTSNNNLIIDFGNSYSNLSNYILKVHNSIGQTVYSTSISQQQTTVNLSSWTGNGIYFVQLIDGSGNVIDIKKIVLQ